MAALTEQWRQGARQAWSSLAQGWQELRGRASGALTRFRHADEASAPSSPAGGALSIGWGLMAADIVVEDERIVVRIEAPGLRREDLHIDVDRDRLSIWGEKHIDAESSFGDYRLVQCAYGSFRRELELPLAVDASHAQASYRDGVLRIEMPRLGQGRRIPVHGA